MDARYVTTSSSLVYKYPHTPHTATASRLSNRPSVMARNITTCIAICAARGLSTPNSFETLML